MRIISKNFVNEIIIQPKKNSRKKSPSAVSAAASMSKPAYNVNNPGIKRLLSELRELQQDPSTELMAQPLDVCLS